MDTISTGCLIFSLVTLYLGRINFTAAQRGCQEGWKYFDGKCYFFSRQKLQWASASYVCAELGGTLAHIETEGESEFLENMSLNGAYVGCFNDGKDRLLSGDFFYSDVLTNKHCLEHCRKGNFEFSATQFYGQCYCGNSTADGFIQSGSAQENKCNLPCFGNKNEMCGGHWKLSVYFTYGQQHWIGGTDEIFEGKWMWFPGKTPITYSNWLPSEPNNQLHSNFCQEHCLSLYPNRNGTCKWNDEDCSQHLRFICEKMPLFQFP